MRKKINFYSCKEEKILCMDAYGNRCAVCRKKDLETLEIDHIYDDGDYERTILNIAGGCAFYRYLRRLGYPKDRYQILCKRCNHKKMCIARRKMRRLYLFMQTKGTVGEMKFYEFKMRYEEIVYNKTRKQ